MKLLVPFYDLRYAARLLAIARKLRGRMAVIVNVNDGPGANVDKEWKKIVDELLSLGCEVYGYTELVSWNKEGTKSTPLTRQAIEHTVVQWRAWYGIKRLFYDDWQKGRTIVPQDLASCIANPGEDVDTLCTTTVVWESENYQRSKIHQTRGGTKNVAVIAMREGSYLGALNLARARNIAYFYAVPGRDDWHAYDDLPSYFESLAAAV